MQKTWVDFCKLADIGQDSIPFSHDDWFGWLDSVAKNYQEPLALSSGLSDWNDR